MILFENLAANDRISGDEYDQATRDSGWYDNQNRKEIKVMNEKLDKIMQAMHRTVNFVGKFKGY